MAWKYVTADDQKLYTDFCKHHLVQLANKPAKPLYHYTTGTALVEILRSGTLWAGHMACLNDSRELVHSIELIKAATKKKLEGPLSADAKLLFTRVGELLDGSRPEAFGGFVACFSEKEDDLSQWRAYSGGEGGFVLEFDPRQLLTATSQHGGYLLPVNYDRNKQDAFIDDVMRCTEKFFLDGLREKRAPTTDDWLNDFLDCWAHNLQFIVPMFKDAAFEAEAEWRIIHFLRSEDIPNMKYLQKQSMMARYIPLRFSQPNEHGYTPLPIKRIVVGPARHKEISRISVGDLLNTCGYKNIPVVESRIPFRVT